MYYVVIVGQHSKPVVHFVIQAPNLAQKMYNNMLRTFSYIGPLEILSLCPLYDIGFQNRWFTLHGRFTIYICHYLWI